LTRCVSFYYKEVAMSGDHLGRFEHFLLLAVMRLGDQAYGMTIRRELAEHTGRDIAVGAIYTALARLERRGLVQSWLGQPTAERGGKAKRHYRVLASGRKALDRAEAALTGLSQDLRRAPKRS
jgi:PadR family transcriptional regulator PadR